MPGERTQLRDNVLTLAGIGVILALLRHSASIVEPFLLSLFIVIIASAPLDWMRKRGLSSGVAVAIMLVAIVAVLGGISMLLSGAAAQFSQALPGYEGRLSRLVDQADGWLADKGVNLHEDGVFNLMNPESLFGYAQAMLSGIGGVLSNALLIVFIVTFMLAETAHLPAKLKAMGAGESSARTLSSISKVIQSVNQYVEAKAFVSLLTGVAIWVGLRLVGLDYAGLWGFLAFVLNFVPNVGSILAAIPAVLIAVLQLEPLMVVVVVVIYVAVNMIIGNVVDPLITGQRVGLSTVTVFLSLVFWGWMFGAVGMLLSVPLSMVVKSIAESNAQTRWLSILMAPVSAPTAGPADREVDSEGG